jgi:hypothetical protein
MSTGCVFAKNGENVIERRAAWREEYPLGACERLVQARNCTCGADDCTDFEPSGTIACTSGCETARSGRVAAWTEERVRFAQPLSTDTCRRQVQKRGAICRGTFGGEVNATWEDIAHWCVPDGNACSSAVALFLYENCTLLASLLSPAAPSLPPPSWTGIAFGEEMGNKMDDDVVWVACAVAGGVLLLAVTIGVAVLVWERCVLDPVAEGAEKK